MILSNNFYGLFRSLIYPESCSETILKICTKAKHFARYPQSFSIFIRLTHCRPSSDSS